MAKIDALLPGQADIDDLADSIFMDDDQGLSSKWEWGTSFTETIDVTANIEQFCGDPLTSTGSFDLTEFWLSSFGKLMSAMPMPALLIDSSCSIVFTNESCAKSGADLGTIHGASLLGLLLVEADRRRIYETVIKVFDKRKPEATEAVLKTTTENIWARMNFRAVRLRKKRLLLVIIEDLTAEKKLEILSRRQEERLRRARDTLHQVRDELERRSPAQVRQTATSHQEFHDLVA